MLLECILKCLLLGIKECGQQLLSLWVVCRSVQRSSQTRRKLDLTRQDEECTQSAVHICTLLDY
jgi:hypothetical protein